jgi:hypothetical protein
MKKYSLSELVKRWEREELTVEQGVGQILLWLVSLAGRVDKLEGNRPKSQQSNTGS